MTRAPCSWLERQPVHRLHGFSDGILYLTTPSGVAVDRVKADFIPDILEATARADEFVEQVVIILRKL